MSAEAREELITTMAQGISKRWLGTDPAPLDPGWPEALREMARAALAAIEATGAVVVPREAGSEVVRLVGPGAFFDRPIDFAATVTRWVAASPYAPPAGEKPDAQ